MTEIHDPGNASRIDMVYVFLSIDAEGRNGICAGLLPGVGATPFVASSMPVVEIMKDVAKEIAAKTGKRIGMFAFQRCDDGPIWSTDQ